ncbi:MAG: glycoside hydrolase family protein [Campylobacter sp.]|uniref:glycoside hydrolase family protein n=1 Tax=Campylobacter sp. TaxID=205 RepID=UPI00259D1FED|nr:glycoside hydrolase family protein [Campylobacter sp.]MBQ8609916.1 glycoside hydrolase family protein [Campylobacter sp.]
MNLIDSIKENEGFRDHIYKDTLGFDTIGYGFKCDSLTCDELELNDGIIEPMSKEVADKILRLKLAKLTSKVYDAIPWLNNSPKQVQEVVIEMAYQMGVDGVLKFKNTLNFIKENDYKNASSNMMKSLWAKQTPNRAKKLANIIERA